MTTLGDSFQYDVIVVGGGAAGLMCAFTAAQRGRRVLVLERSNKVGKKILMSGGGRCNFTNQHVEPENFISNNPHFCKSALSRYTQWDFIAMVERHGIEYEERKHGQLFCLHSAKDILSMLLKECELARVEIRTHCDIENIQALPSPDNEHSSYRLAVVKNNSPAIVTCQSLVIASGALSIPSLGGSGMGYDVANQFKLPVTERRAGLVPLMFSDSLRPLCERLSGISVEVEVSCNNHSFTENLLFTHRGISGPVILQISNYWRPGEEISIDLLPGINAYAWLLELKKQGSKGQLKSLLQNHSENKLARSLIVELQGLWWPDLADKPLAEISDSKLSAIAGHLNSWRLKPSATEGYRTAEVTLGGIDTNSISSKTMETREHPGLYFVGEVLDVTGHLGGYNFQWAWSSGYSAGLSA